MKRMKSLNGLLLSLICGASQATSATAAILLVPSAPHPTIQSALDAAQPGDEIHVAPGTYNEALTFTRCGLPGQPITLMGAPGDLVTPGALPRLDTAGTGAANAILIPSCSHVRVIRFIIRDHAAGNDGSAVRITGSATDVEIRGNLIRNVTGTNAMAITVYGTAPTPISDLVIAGNVIRDIEAAPSEAVTLNGNVDGFLIENNVVRDVNNIGIDMIGGETDIQPNPALVARNGIVRRNVVLAANSNYEGGYAAGIYVDGGRDIVIEGNHVEGCDLGIEIGAENAGLVTSNVIVRNNQVSLNEKAGLVVGGYAQEAGRTQGVVFRGNTLVGNNTLGENGVGTYFTGGGVGEIWVQWADQTVFEHNLVQAAPPIAAPLDIVYVGQYDGASATNTSFSRNLYWSTDPTTPGAGFFDWGGARYSSLAAWQAAPTGFDVGSIASDPQLFLNLVDDVYELTVGSPALDAGDPGFVPALGEADVHGGLRLRGAAVDLGADELGSALIFADGFELGDFSAWIPEVP
ncbi:MAG: hypothetical protein HC897_04015 [Thermoanaerobaculia bacterium]|nr:hypothetical protein [Thermoanaerobaculia bacterium]